MGTLTLKQIADVLGAELRGDGDIPISGVATLKNATPNHLSFLANSKYRSQLSNTAAGALILSHEESESFQGNSLAMANPYMGYALAAQLLDSTPAAADGIHPSAVIHSEASLEERVSIGPNAVIEAGAVLAEGVQVGAGCFVGKNTVIGANTKLWPNVTLYHRVVVGAECILHSGVVVGSDGFGYANDKGRWVKIPQLGSVSIGDNVEIGASTTIDRGALDDTLIENGVIIDNQCQIAHNAIIGAESALAGCTVIAGSTKLGRNCVIGGNTAIAGHLEFCDGTHITGMARITKGTTKPGVYSSGSPMMPNKEWRKNAVRFRQLDDMYRRLRNIEKQLAQRADEDQ